MALSYDVSNSGFPLKTSLAGTGTFAVKYLYPPKAANTKIKTAIVIKIACF